MVWVGNQLDFRLGPAEAPLVLTTLYTFGEPVILRSVLLTNTSALPITYKLHLVVPSGTAAAGNLIIPDINIPPTDSYTQDFGADGIPCTGGGVPAANDTLQHIASGAGLNVTVVLSRKGR